MNWKTNRIGAQIVLKPLQIKRNRFLLFAILVGILGLGVIVGYFKEQSPQPRLPEIPVLETPYRPEVLKQIMLCESQGDRLAQNPVSSALGIFQIIDSTKELCERNLGVKIDRTNVEDSWKCSLWLYERYGLSPWQQCADKLHL